MSLGTRSRPPPAPCEAGKGQGPAFPPSGRGASPQPRGLLWCPPPGLQGQATYTVPSLLLQPQPKTGGSPHSLQTPASAVLPLTKLCAFLAKSSCSWGGPPSQLCLLTALPEVQHLYSCLFPRPAGEVLRAAETGTLPARGPEESGSAGVDGVT